ncbi:MAG: cryptochrome/photolyase family protein, partial [Aeromonas sp.]|nr:cryptochrome/photolyase family protein [Aeromonas sp.]
MELRLILGDQLNASHSWFRTPDPGVCYLLAELRQETDYCRHHRQKVLAFFAAMRAFAAALTKAGHRVCYLTLDETRHWPNLPALLDAQIIHHQASRFAW